eukprot:INCI14744.9.p1 GENE.INCI14744.9~~INCI14744.9.p1  ORF type:complete len:622 (-),score=100.96 INCI14744.9:1185-3050(-)
MASNDRPFFRSFHLPESVASSAVAAAQLALSARSGADRAAAEPTADKKNGGALVALHYGLNFVAGRPDFSTAVENPALPEDLLNAAGVACRALAGEATSAAVSQPAAGTSNESIAPNTCSVFAAVSSVRHAGYEDFEVPIYLIALNADCKMLPVWKEQSKDAPGIVPLPRGSIVSIVSPLLQFEVAASTTALTQQPVGSSGESGGVGGSGVQSPLPDVVETPLVAIFRRLTALSDIRALAQQAADGKMSKKQMKRRVRALIKDQKSTSQGTNVSSTATKKRPGSGEVGGLRKKNAKSYPLPAHLAQTVRQGEAGMSNSEAAVTSASTQSATHLPELELEYVQRVYDSIAPHWHGTRYRTWPRVEAFIASQPKGALIGDFGCGNGKNLPACRDRARGHGIGFDFSVGLLDICRARNGAELPRTEEKNSEGANDSASTSTAKKLPNPLEVVAADAVNLPIREGVFDAALSIAVLHHISSKVRRLRLVEQTMRALRVGGSALFYAWALEQDRGNRSGHRFDDQDVLVPWHLAVARGSKAGSEKNPGSGSKADAIATPEAHSSTSRTDAGTTQSLPRPQQTAALPPEHAAYDAQKQAVVVQRYCHVYQEGELRALLEPLSVRFCR